MCFSRDEKVELLMGDRTLSLSIKDDVEDLTQMFQRHSTGVFEKSESGWIADQ